MKKPERQFPERKSGILRANPEPLHIGGATNANEPQKPSKPAKKAVTVQLSEEPLKEARALVTATYGNPEAYGTFNAFMDAALQAEIEKARMQFNNGEPFPYKRDGDVALKKGRPLGS